MKKLKRGNGETLVELLISMLIIALGMLMLSGAIVSAARLNQQAETFADMGGSTGSDDAGNASARYESVTVIFENAEIQLNNDISSVKVKGAITWRVNKDTNEKEEAVFYYYEKQN
ncbi:MAG: prepilin-type N-terminal cleavage/methylation domain-containing protein [Oscillibacter sp.]|nr:prepilin-type N-terminal cleavage/methylation domain-containing protein [Oscillibacter sp.]